MSKVKILTLLVIGLMMINVAMLAFMFLKKPSRRLPGGRLEPKNIIIDKLHFDEAQVKAYEKLIEAHRQRIHGLNDEIIQTKNALYQTLNQANGADVVALQNKLGNLQVEIEQTHYEHFKAIKKICRANQMADFDDLSHELSALFSPEKKMPPPPKD